ncbi:MAG: HAMP domain-containing sensor histidine kinase, partial [Chloroflexota bacterium]
MSPPRWPFGFPVTTLAVLAATDAAVLAVMQLALGPPLADLLQLGSFLFVSGLAALVLGSAVPFLARRGLIRSVRFQLVLIPVLVVALTMANVGFIGHLMFVSPHDLGLRTVVLLFALSLSVLLAFTLSEVLRGNIRTLSDAVGGLGAGNLRVRAMVATRDELGMLADTLNVMAERLESAFTRQQELETARRQMVVAVSHDLRTPLSSMRAVAESLNDGIVTDPATVRRYLRSIESEVARLSTLIDDLFELSQIDAGSLTLHREPSSLRDLVSDVLVGMAPRAEQQGVALTGEVDESLPSALVDPQRMHRVLSNLVQNALQHTRSGQVFIHGKAAGPE